MVYHKRTYRKKRVYRKKRSMKYRRGMRYNKRGQKIYYFKRYTGDLGTTSASNITPTFGAIAFQLNDLPNVSDFTNLYDSYRINAVKISFIPQMNTSISIGSINNPSAAARFFSVIDYNDSNNPTSVDELRQYQSCKYTPILRKHNRYIYRPKIQDRGNTYTPGRPWINCDSDGQPHFGLKFAIEPMGSTTTTEMVYNIEAKFYLSFKNVR